MERVERLGRMERVERLGRSGPHERAVWLAGPASAGHDGEMIGVAIIVVVLVVAIPVGVLVSSAAAAWILGLVLRTDVESRFEGSELLELN